MDFGIHRGPWTNLSLVLRHDSAVWTYLILTKPYCCVCFRDEETEAQRDQVLNPRTQSSHVVGLEVEPQGSVLWNSTLWCLSAGRATQHLWPLEIPLLFSQSLLGKENISSPPAQISCWISESTWALATCPFGCFYTGRLFVKGELEFHSKAFFFSFFSAQVHVRWGNVLML